MTEPVTRVGTPCAYTDCNAVIPFRTQWVPYGDGSQGTWTSVIDYRAMNAHIATDHKPRPERAVVRKERYL